MKTNQKETERKKGRSDEKQGGALNTLEEKEQENGDETRLEGEEQRRKRSVKERREKKQVSKEMKS